MEPVLKINLDSLYKNSKNALKKSNVIAVVKNNAYNMGLEKAVSTFYSAGINAFATTSLNDAIDIRKMLSDVDIILINPSYDFDLLRKHNIISTLSGIEFLEENIENMNGIRYHIEWAGEMRRSGCKNEFELESVLNFAKNNGIKINGIWTHFAWADTFGENSLYSIEKERWFSALKIAKSFFDFEYIHSQNSASFVRDGIFESHTHTRLGIYLYGCYPYSNIDSGNGNEYIISNCELHHPIDITAEVISIRNLYKGDSIGYCSTYKAETDIKVAIIGIGYGDGILRKRIVDSEVEINSKRYKTVAIMMSHIVAIIDEDVSIGDTVYIYSESIPIYEFTCKGVGSNSEQLSALNHNTLKVVYKREKF